MEQKYRPLYMIAKILILVILFQLVIFNNISNAGIWSDIISGGDKFIQDGKANSIPVEDTKLQDVSDTIFYVCMGVGVSLAVIVGMFLGIQFMVASAESKAELKQGLVAYVISLIVMFGAFGIWKLCITVFRSF